jgi:TrmH family RNA methyltransferase
MLVRVFIETGRQEEYQLLMQQNPHIEFISLDKQLLDTLCDTEHPQGVAAVVRIPQYDLQEVLNKSGLILLLDQLSDPGNMGTIIRTATAFGVDGILLTPDCVDPFSPKVVRSSMGGILKIPVYSDVDLKEIEQLRGKGYTLFCSLPKAEDNLYDLDFTGRSIIVIGNESHGVSSIIQKLCHQRFKIPHDSQVESLNAAVACAIIIGEAFRQRRPSLF